MSWMLALLLGTPPASAQSGSRALADLVGVSAEHRSRVEAVSSSFRRPGHDVGLFLRTLARLRLGTPGAALWIEALDARRYGAGPATSNSPGLINPIDLLQAHVRLAGEDLLQDGDAFTVRMGRVTLDAGSRRLVARNRYRNTINAFTGLTAGWTARTGSRIGAFALVPVRRRPRDSEALDANRPVLDREALGTWFFGLDVSRIDLQTEGGPVLEVLALGLLEADTERLSTRDRRLGTLSARLVRPPREGELHYDVELVGQGGASRLDTVAAEDLTHLAGFAHLGLGFTLPGAAAVRPRLSVDLASGDGDPSDGWNTSFDTLYGARRFAYGPTGIWGAFARGNLLSPEARVSARAHDRVRGFVAWRPAWLASPRQGWVGTPLFDSRGDSGRFLGQQLESRVRWEVRPDELRLEAGAAWLARGTFARTAPDAPPGRHALLVYCQVHVWLRENTRPDGV